MAFKTGEHKKMLKDQYQFRLHVHWDVYETTAQRGELLEYFYMLWASKTSKYHVLLQQMMTSAMFYCERSPSKAVTPLTGMAWWLAEQAKSSGILFGLFFFFIVGYVMFISENLSKFK